VTVRKKKPAWGGSRKGAGRKPSVKDARPVTVKLEAADHAALERLADKKGVSISRLVRDAIRAYLGRRRK